MPSSVVRSLRAHAHRSLPAQRLRDDYANLIVVSCHSLRCECACTAVQLYSSSCAISVLYTV